MFFIWQQEDNEQHIAKHGIETHEAEFLVRNPKRPHPRRLSEEKWLIRGRTMGRRLIQVIYVIRSEEQIDIRLLTPFDRLALQEGEKAVYVIHARELPRGEK